MNGSARLSVGNLVNLSGQSCEGENNGLEFFLAGSPLSFASQILVGNSINEPAGLSAELAEGVPQWIAGYLNYALERARLKRRNG